MLQAEAVWLDLSAWIRIGWLRSKGPEF